VLESVATHPGQCTHEAVVADCLKPDFKRDSILTMLWQLKREGLIGVTDHGHHFLTQAGFNWLTEGKFDRCLPAPHTRPKGRKARKRPAVIE
jgi:hypothetical protein